VVQRYGVANQYKDHYDWFPDGPYIDGNIEFTSFVYIQVNCTGGGTNFPCLKTPEDEKWCNFVGCDETYDAGVTFKPITGN
jgi:prolyl 4-hydroxylase